MMFILGYLFGVGSVTIYAVWAYRKVKQVYP
jgi:hypothetical protein